MQTMYPGQVNSPVAELAENIDDSQTTITLDNASILPDAPNICTINIGEDAETILYTGKDGNDITGVSRGFQGPAKSWSAGTKVRRMFTAYDYDSLRQNSETHWAENVTQVSGVHGLEIEQGLFTPYFKGSNIAGEHTYSQQIGEYIRTGKIVCVTLRVSVADFDETASGTLIIDGLPFSVKPGFANNAGMTLSLVQYWEASVEEFNNAIIYATNNTTQIQFRKYNKGQVMLTIPISTLRDSSTITLTGTYMIN